MQASTPESESEYKKITFSLPQSTIEKLRAVTKRRHGRVDRFVSATLDQLIEEAFEREVMRGETETQQ